MMVFDENGHVQDYTIILALRTHEHLGQITNIEKESVVSKINMNAANELSFTVYKYRDGKKTALWDDITDFKYVYVKELDEYYEIVVETTEEDTVSKAVTGTSACECELAQSYLYDFEVNSEADIKRDDYTAPTIFYNELEPKRSLLHRALSKLPQYSIGHVDGTLQRLQRTFSESDVDVHSFLTETVAEEIGCLFTFDSVNRVINVYDLKNVCMDCGYRGEFSDVCPKCGSTDIQYYGEDTTVYVDRENLAESVSFSTDTDSVKNCFKLVAGDDNMTAAVRNRNPNGSDYIYYFSEEAKKDMGKELVDKLNAYDKLVASYDKEYGDLMKNMYEYIDKVVYYTSGMMPKRENDPTDAKKEGAKLNSQNLSPLGMPELTKSTSVQTVNTALRQYAKVFIKSGYFKAEIDKSDFYMNGVQSDGTLYGTWTGNFIVTNYSDDEDTYTTPAISITVTNKYYDFLQQKIDKKLADEDVKKEGSIYDVLSIKDLNDFKKALELYGLNRLKSFADSIQGCIDIMIESDQANENAELYNELYIPYLDKLKACNSEIDKRTATIKDYNDKLEVAQKRQREIQKALNFQDFLGEDLYLQFCLFKREDKYSNDNYISDDLENNEIFENAEAFLEAAKTELVKSGEHQHSLSGSLINLLAMEEFKPLRDKFKEGNFIRVKSDDKIYRLRLTSYEINFGNIQTLDVEFSDMTKIRTGTSDLQSVLSKASSMAGSYGAVTNQVKSSKETNSVMKDFINRGLDATVMKVVNNADNQNITIGDSGLLARRKEDFSELYSQYQLKILSTGLYITENDWRTVSCAIGKYYAVDPETGKQEVKYGVLAKNLVGELLLGNALKIYSEDNSSEMSFDNHGLVLNAKDNGSGLYRRILDIQRDGKSQLWIDEQGNIVLASDQFIQMGNKLDRVVADYADIEKLYVKSADIEKLLAGYIKADQIEVIKGEFKELFAEKAEIKDLQAEHVTINGKLSAQDAEIENLKATKIEAGDLEAYKATIEKLLATYATIKELEANYIKAKDIEATYAKITELDATNANIEKLNAATAEINKLIANKADIEDLKAVNAQIDTLQTNYANINELVAKKVDAEYVQAEIVKANKTITDQLDAVNATIENLNTKYATIEQLKAARAELDDLIAKKATIEELNAAKATIGTLDAQLANINTIMSGSIGTGILQTLHLTAENVNIDKAVIQDLIAANIAVSDLKAGEISTDKFTIKSADGTMQIVGSTQQFLDENGKVRLQIGKDKQGHFNFIVYGQDGEGKIFDQDGIKAAGIPSNTIVDSMVADNANISGSKLNINSVVDKINEDGTTSINSNKIWIDEENQSLGASFTQIKTSVDNTVKSYTPYYCKSTSNTTPPADGWDEIPPSKLDGEYIWRKEKVVKTDNTVSWTTPYVVTGDSGTSPIQIIVTSTNGTSFKQNSTQTTTTLQCVVYRGENKITPNSYNWYQYNGTTWVSLNKTTSSISITLSDVKDVNRYKCVVDV